MAYSFVLSYARNDAFINSDKTRPDPHFKAFVDRLNRRCLQVTGFAGFVDTSEILPGEDWRDELAESLRTTQALVCLYCPSFFLSEYCGQEMRFCSIAAESTSVRILPKEAVQHHSGPLAARSKPHSPHSARH